MSDEEDREMSGVREGDEGDRTEGHPELGVDPVGDVQSGDAPDGGADQDQPDEGVEEEVVRTPILWHSNAPWVGSGYGTQTALFGPLIQRDLGYDVGFSAFFGLKGRKLGWIAPHTGTMHAVYPGGKDNHGNDIVGAHTVNFFARRTGMVVLLSDVWVMRVQAAAALPLLAWAPVDHDPVIPDTVEWFRKTEAIPVAMSRFGEEQLVEAGLKLVQYVPHGFNGKVFKPAERKQARKALGIPEDAFVVGMVAANVGQPSRKRFSQAFQAFAQFKAKHDDAVLYLHTLTASPSGEDLTSMADSLGIHFLACDQYGYVAGMSDPQVAATMNSFDVLVNCAQGEGFGVPLIEAQACGTPVISTDFSAMPEVAPSEVGNWLVGGQLDWTGFKSWQMTPSVEQIVECLEQAYSDTEAEAVARRVSVWKHAQQYEAETVTREHWAPVLKRAEEELAWRRKRARRFS